MMINLGTFISGASAHRRLGDASGAQLVPLVSSTPSCSVLGPTALSFFKDLTTYAKGTHTPNPNALSFFKDLIAHDVSKPRWFKWPFPQTSLDPSCPREAYLGMSPLSQLIWARQSGIVRRLFEELYRTSRDSTSSLKPAHLDYLLVVMGKIKVSEWSQLYPKHKVQDVERILFKVCQAIIRRHLKVTDLGSCNIYELLG